MVSTREACLSHGTEIQLTSLGHLEIECIVPNILHSKNVFG